MIKDFTPILEQLFTDAKGKDRCISREDLKAAGIPSRYAATVLHRSKHVMSDTDAKEAAADLGASIATYYGELDTADPRKLADLIRR